jgi:protease-4
MQQEATIATVNVFANRAIAASLQGELAIDAESGLAYLNQYLLDLALIASGASISEIGLSERRREKMGYTIQAGARVYDSASLYNPDMTQTGSVAVLRVTGFMQAEASGGSSPVRGMRSFAEDLYAAYDNPNIKGVLVEVNSGGGELMAMEVATSAIEARNKPVLAHVFFASSAAYGLAASTDEVIALSSMTRVGGVGAVVSLNRRALQEYADEWIDLYGATAPRKNAEFRAALQGDYSLLQRVVDDATERFQKKVAKARGLDLSDELAKDALSGDMFTAYQAKRRGLIDGIGGLNYVLKRLDAWADIYKQKV